MTKGGWRARGAIAVVASTTAAICAAFACTVTDGLRVPGRDAPDAAAPPEAEADADVDAGCVPERIPSPSQSELDGEGFEYVFAMKEIRFKFDPALGNVGFDLDNACTCYPDKDTCRVASPEPHCDGEHGRDNALATLSQSVALPPELDVEAWINGQLTKGKTGLLLKLAGYNGQPNDRLVQVSFYPSTGIEQTVDGGADPPTWTKADRWKVDPTRLWDTTNKISSFVSPKAYVVDGKLVANFAATFPLGGLEVTIDSGAFVAELHTDDPPSLEHGVIVGRWDLNLAVKALGQMRVGDKHACELDFFAGLASKVCAVADLRLLPTEDGKDDLPCNALSVGIGFAATEGSLGGLEKIPPPSPCPDAGVVECK